MLWVQPKAAPSKKHPRQIPRLTLTKSKEETKKSLRPKTLKTLTQKTPKTTKSNRVKRQP